MHLFVEGFSPFTIFFPLLSGSISFELCSLPLNKVFKFIFALLVFILQPGKKIHTVALESICFSFLNFAKALSVTKYKIIRIASSSQKAYAQTMSSNFLGNRF